MDRILKFMIFAGVALIVGLSVREVLLTECLKIDLEHGHAWLDETEISLDEARALLNSERGRRLRVTMLADGVELPPVSARFIARMADGMEEAFERREQTGSYEGIRSDDPEVDSMIRLLQTMENLERGGGGGEAADANPQEDG